MEVSEEERQRLAQDGETWRGVQPIRKSWIGKRWTWLILLGLTGVILAVVLAVTMRPGSGTSVGRDGSTNRIASEHSPGSEVTLYVQGRESVMVAVDEKALDELIGAMSTRGDEAQTLIQSGRVFTVPNKTRVRIIEAAFAKLKVRIIEGDRIMFEVWVPERWVR
jgi:hypothetical protein